MLVFTYSSGQKRNVAVYVQFRLVCTEWNNRSVVFRFWFGTRLHRLLQSFPVYVHWG